MCLYYIAPESRKKINFNVIEDIDLSQSSKVKSDLPRDLKGKVQGF